MCCVFGVYDCGINVVCVCVVAMFVVDRVIVAVVVGSVRDFVVVGVRRVADEVVCYYGVGKYRY